MKLCSAREMATRWGISIQLVRRYCKEGKIADAVLSEQGWMIPEGALKPGALAAREAVITPLVKRMLYERERNNHYGIYEYIQVNLAYSSSRMASNRLTLMQVEDIYRTNKIATAFEPTKVDDIIEIKNHFIAMRYIVDNIHTPLSVDFIRQIHYLLSYGTHADIYHKTGVGEFRTQEAKLDQTSTTPPQGITAALNDLLRTYEKKDARLDQILDFHVQFERIRPFEDYNGRVGRIIMMKECLRYGVTPFIIDDKRRSGYMKGVRNWQIDRSVLLETVRQAQERLHSKMDICKMMQYHRQPNH